MITIKIITSILISPLSGLLSAMAGSDDYPKVLRRIVIPVLVTLNAAFVLWHWGVIFLMGLALPYSKGHGVPDKNDDGSSIGKFWYKITNGSHKATDILIRLTKGVMKAIVMLTVAFITGQWIVYGICAIGIIGTNVLFGGDLIREGGFELFDTELNWEEFLIAFFDVLFINSLLWFKIN